MPLPHPHLTSPRPQHVAWIDAHVLRLCAAVRGEAAGLVDAFGLSDFVIGSPLGRADGDVYRAYMARVQAVPGAAGPTPVRQWEGRKE